MAVVVVVIVAVVIAGIVAGIICFFLFKEEVEGTLLVFLTIKKMRSKK